MVGRVMVGLDWGSVFRSNVHSTYSPGIANWAVKNNNCFAEWRDVTPQVALDYEYPLESNPLQVRTDSVYGSDDMVNIYFSGVLIWIYFKDYTYYVNYCSSHSGSRLKLSNVPSTPAKIWTFTKSATSLKISCNGKEVASLVFDDVDKGKYNQCVGRWKPVNNIRTITFGGYGGRASKQYRRMPGIIDIFTF